MRLEAVVSKTFASLRIRNYRLFFIGQAISQSGTWMQTIAMSWLVLELGGHGTKLGALTATQFLPMLLFGAYGGVLADRFPKRKLLYFTQTIAGLQAALLGTLVATHHAQLWMLYPLAAVLGFTTVIDNPARQTFVLEMVGRDQLTNALTLNSTLMNLARVVGPAVGGVLIAVVGLAACFLLNAVSYVAVLVALTMIRDSELHAAPLARKAKGQIVEGLRYVRGSPVLRNTLLMMAIVGTLTYEFSTSLPLFARFTLHGDASALSLLNSAMGAGAVVGGILSASRARSGPRRVAVASLLFGVFVLAASVTPNLPTAMLAFAFVGIASIIFTSLGNVTIQLESDPAMRGRVMGLWAVAFVGTTPIGGPIIGWIGEIASPRWALVVSGVAALLAAAIGLASAKHSPEGVVAPSEETSGNLANR